ncbi:MAG: condensation domain-containing protein [Chitinophagaceae bacterium]
MQFADYALWQHNYFQGEVLDRKIDYWTNKLEDTVPLQLPTDYMRPPVKGIRGVSIDFLIEKSLSHAVEMLCKQEGTTLFMTLLAAFKVLLHRYSGQQDICVGTSLANRTQQEVEGLVGFFVNTLALRSEVKSDASFAELLQQVRLTTMESYEHQDLPFEKVVEVAVRERDLSRNPLFDVMLVIQNTPEVQQLRLGEVQLSVEEFTHDTAKFDITFFITNTVNGLFGSVEYATDLYKEATISRMIDHFKTLLNSIVTLPQQKIGELPMLTHAEEHQLLAVFNDTAVDCSKDKTVVKLFEQQAAKTPDSVAVVFKDKRLSYHQLNERANQLASYLRSKGIQEETLVPICIERSLEMVVGILAILKAGCAYVPIDPEYPEERMDYILKDTNAKIVVSSKGSYSKLQASASVEVIEIDKDWPVISTQPADNVQTNVQPHHLAYIIYTSGSTGKPKGVMIEHKSIVHYLLNNRTRYINEKEKGSGSFIHLSYTFDASLTAMFMPLISGKSVILGSKQGLEVFRRQ